MTTKQDDRITPEDQEAKKLYGEYKQLRQLLEYIRVPETQRLLREMGQSTLNLPKPKIRRRSRI